MQSVEESETKVRDKLRVCSVLCASAEESETKVRNQLRECSVLCAKC